MISESLAPVELISVVWACRPLHFGVALNMSKVMGPELRFSFCEDPAMTVLNMPIFIGYPDFSFVRVSSSPPFLELLKQLFPTSVKGFCGYHRFVIVGPSTYHWI